jgi:nucleoid DNA-binding protein
MLKTIDLALSIDTEQRLHTAAGRRAVVEHIRDEIVEALHRGEEVRIDGLGTFVVQNKPARVARNPLTGETIMVPPKRAVKFRPAKALREAVNPATSPMVGGRRRA